MLVKSVLNFPPPYHLPIFIIPKKNYKEMDKITRDLVSKGDTLLIPLASWDSICQPKILGSSVLGNFHTLTKQ